MKASTCKHASATTGSRGQGFRERPYINAFQFALHLSFVSVLVMYGSLELVPMEETAWSNRILTCNILCR
jgi:hypothetical protein